MLLCYPPSTKPACDRLSNQPATTRTIRLERGASAQMGCTGDNDKPKRVVGENAGSYSCTDIFFALLFIANLVPLCSTACGEMHQISTR